MDHPQTKQKLSHPVGRDGSEDAGAGPSNVESSPKIFKLSIDCMDEIFEYLSLKDLHSFGQTCKRMNKVAGEYFKQNYSSVQTWFNNGNGIRTYYSDKDGVRFQWIKISGFSQFIPSILIVDGDFNYIQSRVSDFESVERISIELSIIDIERIKFIQQLLGKLEMVELFHCSID
ncbi:uncharacterized protein LOC116351253, partial [Contarinia nasturtii]|uniref:uncharacterized protein LOC116350134 n=1 Tax=Contarinia nasturtii TaxID=265458 RepID=UPI0012D39334